MDAKGKDMLLLQYQEGNASARAIDGRIWAVYGLYFLVNGGALALLFQPGVPLPHYRVAAIGIAMVFAGVAQMALIGHLQSYSDYFFERLRQIEADLGIFLHRPIGRTPISSHLWGPHLWLSDWRARSVMQVGSIALCFFWFCYPVYKAAVNKYPGISQCLNEPTNVFGLTLAVFLSFAVYLGYSFVKKRRNMVLRQIHDSRENAHCS